MDQSRAQWSSKVGFILAASGSAIGLGNIVFFGANAYTYGAGAFYLPYLLALFVVGIPVLITELGLGSMTQKAFPTSLGQVAGRWGEFAGWWGLLNASFITMYYITILAWVVGMFIGSFGPLWRESSTLPAFAEVGSLGNPQGFFFHMLSSWWVLLLVILVWFLNLLIVRRGVQTIEPAVKVFVPLMWIFMLILIVRGVTLPQGEDGVFLLFTPDFAIMKNPAVWQGAASQIFFSLTLGFGVMTAYASYLPRNADQINNGLVTACMNCSFEFIAGVAIFSLLFTFAIVPQASTLGMMFFVIPQGIAAMPTGVMVFGLLFFLLLLLAGLSSSISLIEGLCCAMIDKFGWPRRRTLSVACLVGVLGSMLFALPMVVDSRLAGNGTLGLSLLDLVDHWAFSHGLLIVGLVECLILGWKLPVAKLREHLNRASRFHLPAAFDWLIKLLIPAALVAILGSSAWSKLTGGIYRGGTVIDETGLPLLTSLLRSLPLLAFLAWLASTVVVALLLTFKGPRLEERAPAATAARAPETSGA